MKITTRIATIIVAADPVTLPITNAAGTIAAGIAGFGLEIAMETARLREEKNRSALERARIAAREAGVPVALIKKAEASASPIQELQAETARWRSFRKTMDEVRKNENPVVDDTSPFIFEEFPQ